MTQPRGHRDEPPSLLPQAVGTGLAVLAILAGGFWFWRSLERQPTVDVAGERSVTQRTPPSLTTTVPGSGGRPTATIPQPPLTVTTPTATQGPGTTGSTPTTGTAPTSPSGVSIGTAGAWRLADFGNGVLDSLAVTFPVTVQKAGTYSLTLDVVSPKGEITSASGDATLQPGQGRIEVFILLQDMVATSWAGPYPLTNAELATEEVDDSIVIARRSDVGSAGPIDLSRVQTALP